MDDRRRLRAFALVMLLIGAVSATVLVSCGGGGSDGDSNGALCEQCGDTDGPCNAAGALTTGDDRPSGCPTDPDLSCQVELRCTRKVDSGQRRCFPVDPTTNQLDFRYECDGSRPIESFAPTPTPIPTATFTPSASATPIATGPTATGATPAPTATPGEAEDVSVTITITDPNDNDLPSTFTGAVTYPTSKGKFVQGGALECDADDNALTAQDDGNGTLALSFSGDSEGISELGITCTFHQVAGQTLVNADLAATVNPTSLTITIDEL